MSITTRPRSDGSPHRNPYDLDMAKRDVLGIQELRSHLKTVVARVEGTDEVPSEHIVFTRHNKRIAVLVPMQWYRDAAEKMGEPTEL